MKNYRKLIVLLSLALALSAHAEIAATKRAEIDKMLRLTGMEKLMDQMKTQMLDGLKSSMPDAPAGFWEKFSAKMDTRELLEKIIPIYDQYYTIEDLRAVNAFYSSPAGQKVLSSLPQVMQASMKAGQEWGEKIGQEAAEEVAGESKAGTQEGAK
jgi:hypothetical protein